MDKLAAIEAEMAKFESEIAANRVANDLQRQQHQQQQQYGSQGSYMAPPMPPMRPPMPSFMMPHQLMARHTMPMRHVFPPMPQPMGGQQPQPPPPPQANIIEAAPTSYSKNALPGSSAAAASGVPMPKKGPFAAASSSAKIEEEIEQAATEDAAKPGSSKKKNKGASGGQAGGSGHTIPMPGQKGYRYVRVAGNEIWEDQSLGEWDPNDYRLFAGDLGNEVSDELLAKTFRKYPSFVRAKVVRHTNTNKSKGYGFVAFRDPNDFLRAMREMNGKYVGNRPIKLKKSRWKERDLNYVRKKMKDKKKLGLL